MFKIDSKWEFAEWHLELNPVLFDNLEKWDGVEVGGMFRRKGMYIYTCVWFMLIYARGQHNIVKQTSSN